MHFVNGIIVHEIKIKRPNGYLYSLPTKLQLAADSDYHRFRVIFFLYKIFEKNRE